MMAAEQISPDRAWRFDALMKGIARVKVPENVTVRGLSSDSRTVDQGDLFIARRGISGRGHDFIPEAIRRGAVAIVYEAAEGQLPSVVPHVPVVAVDGLGEKLGLIADRFFSRPSSDLFVVGVTGTNGKTSCSHFIAYGLSQGRTVPCGVIGTLGSGLYGDLNPSLNTTPGVIEVHRELGGFRDRGARAAVMEVSSHGMVQGRVGGVAVDVAVFTNLSRDHLDYHGDMAAYAEAKKRLFKMPSLSAAVINLDDAYGKEMLAAVPAGIRVIGYRLFDSDQETSPNCETDQVDVLSGTVLGITTKGCDLKLESPWGSGELSSNLLGRFNASNLLAALAVLVVHGIPFAEALSRLAGVSPLPGRMESYRVGSGRPLVVVDYAHTPDALEKVLLALREHCRGELWCVFGCGGDRDKGKRSLMGEIVARHADHAVVTDDNPRHEDPQSIVNGILSGFTDQTRLSVVHDRQTAIHQAIDSACSLDVVLIAGKGHERFQETAGVKHPFSDRDIVAAKLGTGGGGR